MMVEMVCPRGEEEQGDGAGERGENDYAEKIAIHFKGCFFSCDFVDRLLALGWARSTKSHETTHQTD